MIGTDARVEAWVRGADADTLDDHSDWKDPHYESRMAGQMPTAPRPNERTITVQTKNGPKSVQTTMTDDQAAQYCGSMPKQSEFLRSLLQAHSSRRLSRTQANWLHVIAVEDTQTRNRPEQTAIRLDGVGRIAELFRTAGEHLKFPKIRLFTQATGSVVLSVCGERSRYAGSVNVTDGGPYGEGNWYGRIAPDGELTAGKSMTEAIRELLREFAANPAEVAARHGRMTGSCCFCGLGLKDERSTSVGYGPVCADHFGLPWGN